MLPKNQGWKFSSLRIKFKKRFSLLECNLIGSCLMLSGNIVWPILQHQEELKLKNSIKPAVFNTDPDTVLQRLDRPVLKTQQSWQASINHFNHLMLSKKSCPRKSCQLKLDRWVSKLFSRSRIGPLPTDRTLMLMSTILEGWILANCLWTTRLSTKQLFKFHGLKITSPNHRSQILSIT